MLKLPHFKYHPSPLSSGSIEDSDEVCRCCGESRGFIYTGPVYAEEELFDCLCPWCIADGSARAKFDGAFVDEAGIGGHSGQWDEVPKEVMEEIAYRTPGFSGIQQEHWWTHCGDGAEFLRIEENEVIFRCRHCGKMGGYQDFD